ncbi:hypothetical protein FHS38_005732 [Streptomyces netropsis]|uniref:Uncharacterized protein n=1 Tax=Streptomyces netropsis TaxID=55404 RepID=A0A7W7PG58_STRNE|nr:hypothetical protein [Streptomyces netropsis]MBB4889656.1 hypothetical protein [Streptomyces netropsis]
MERAKQYNEEFIKREVDIGRWTEESWRAALHGPSQSREERQLYLDRLVQRLPDTDILPPVPDATGLAADIERARKAWPRTARCRRAGHVPGRTEGLLDQPELEQEPVNSGSTRVEGSCRSVSQTGLDGLDRPEPVPRPLIGRRGWCPPGRRGRTGHPTCFRSTSSQISSMRQGVSHGSPHPHPGSPAVRATAARQAPTSQVVRSL